ncbi:MAG: threonine/serine ThrE exporter family protein [Polyangiales bacterium]
MQGPESARSPEEAIAFVLELGRALHAYGASTPRLEGVLGMVAGRLGIEARFYATPTALLVGIGPPRDGRTALVRVDPGEIDLDKMSRLYDVAVAAAEGLLSPRDGKARIAAILSDKPRGSAPLTVLCHGLAAATTAVFLSGGAREIGLAGGIGLVVGTIALLPARGQGIAAPLASTVASALATLGAAHLGPAAPFLVTLAAVIFLLPGLALTTAMNELATKNLAAGSARLAGAFAQLLAIGFGLALGGHIAARFAPKIVAPPQVSWPLPVLAAAVVLSAIAAATLMRARPRDFGWIMSACAIAFFGARVGASALGPQLGTFVGAFLLALASNAFARAEHRPVAITLVPALLLLVPGSLGLRGVFSLLGRDVVGGVSGAFEMAMVSIALVAGLLVANVVLPNRHHL